MYQQVYDPLANSIGLSALFAVLPLLVLFVLLGGLRWKAHWAALVSLGIALLVALFVYSMPAGQAFNSALRGGVFGLFPIMWVVFNAIWIYNLTVETGRFDVLRRSFGVISNDQRIQAIIIAFCFGSLLEALAGFGTPVAISGAMLVGLGYRPIKAVAVSLVANTAPVALGGVGLAVITLASVTGLPEDELGAMVGRQVPFFALITPFILVFMVDGRRGLRQTWPAALVGGLAFAIAQFFTSNYIAFQITDIVSAFAGASALIVFLRVWSPSEPLLVRREDPDPGSAVDPDPRIPTIEPFSAVDPDPRIPIDPDPAAEGGGPRYGILAGGGGLSSRHREVLEAYAPYVMVVAVLGLAQFEPFKGFLANGIAEFAWPGLNITNAAGEPVASTTFVFNWLPTAGTLLLISGVLSCVVLRVSPARALGVYRRTLDQLKWATLTVATVLALSLVMTLSGQTVTIGLFLAGTGGFFAFLASIVGWFGVAVTGSDTASNALFGALQVAAAKDAGLSPTLMAAANASGGVFGKTISPQNLAVGLAAVGLSGQEGELFRRVVGWSLGLLLLMCVLVYLQSTPLLSWMVP